MNLVLWPAFPVGSVLWYIVTAVAMIFLAEFIAGYKTRRALSTVAIWAAVTTVFGDMTLLQIPQQIMIDPYGSAFKVLAFFALGAIWCLASWIIICCERNENYCDLKYEWLREKGLNPPQPRYRLLRTIGPEIPEELRAEWTNHICKLEQFSRLTRKGWWEFVLNERRPIIKLHWWDYKARHAREICFWFLLLPYWAFNGLIRGFARKVMRCISGLGEMISNWVFVGVDKDFEVPNDGKR
jgi:hypothetical protein